VTASLAYRTHEAAILRGNPPEKYTRLLPHIPGERILEVGSAEGVLACLMARDGKQVTAVEASEGRHCSAIALAGRWSIEPGTITWVHGRIQDVFDQFEDGIFDTLVAVRMIYYLRGAIDEVFAEIAKRIPNVVLCGNKGRAARYHAGTPDAPLGEFNYYASREGMRDVLERHGYEIVGEVTEGDAIVVGRRA
jgi:SAM-dependent methyltransferase